MTDDQKHSITLALIGLAGLAVLVGGPCACTMQKNHEAIQAGMEENSVRGQSGTWWVLPERPAVKP